ncbi:hypothetical protein HPP92_005982 [Vanilla planifolia]|uniref:RNA helicase n=1 Tax=Vanilla planifolia TaxID=51239 RepID=A0A835RZV4_VANPL|nr:hypothetical protein HPP92_005982 [Vanilla planifolia]
MADERSSSSPKKKEEKRSWADEESDDEVPSSASQTADATKDFQQLGLEKIESLSITEEKGKEKEQEKEAGVGLLDNPEDSDIKAVTVGDAVYSSALSFEDLNLSKDLLKGIYVEMGFQRPSKIQAISLPMILTPPYKDLVAQAHNGSGKTTCFVLGMLSRVDPSKNLPQAMCICPTRELARQNQAVLLKMGKYTGITSFLAIPADSASYVPVSKLPPVTDQVVIGTPGTIKKWTSSRKLSTREIKILVFDEADHMLSEDGFRDDSLRIMKDIQSSSVMGCQVLLFSATFNDAVRDFDGFRDDSLRIMKDIQSSSVMGCQVLLFSATFNDAVRDFVSRVVKGANKIFVKKEELTLDKVKQYKVYCPDELAKIEVIKDKIFEFGQKVGQTIIFVQTRDSAKRLHQILSEDGYECTVVHGASKQEDRDQVIKEFKEGITKVLITTDLLARGFDQSQVNLVINYDLPFKHEYKSEPDYEVYLHRIGRTGRFGRKGAAFNFLCTEKDRTLMEKIERHFDHTVPEVGNWRSEEDFEKALKDAGLL